MPWRKKRKIRSIPQNMQHWIKIDDKGWFFNRLPDFKTQEPREFEKQDPAGSDILYNKDFSPVDFSTCFRADNQIIKILRHGIRTFWFWNSQGHEFMVQIKVDFHHPSLLLCHVVCKLSYNFNWRLICRLVWQAPDGLTHWPNCGAPLMSTLPPSDAHAADSHFRGACGAALPFVQRPARWRLGRKTVNGQLAAASSRFCKFPEK